MVRLSAVLGFALAAASVLMPGVLSQDIPACAQSCAQDASLASGCALTDTNCVCNSSTFALSAGQCISGVCTSAADIQVAQAFFLSLCSGTSTTPSLTTDSPSQTDSSTPTDTSSVTSSTTTGTVPSTTTTTTSAVTSTPRTTTSSTSSRSPASVVSPTTSTSSTPSTTPSNHATHDQPAGLLGAGLALGLALFAW